MAGAFAAGADHRIKGSSVRSMFDCRLPATWLMMLNIFQYGTARVAHRQSPCFWAGLTAAWFCRAASRQRIAGSTILALVVQAIGLVGARSLS
jgi:hypothetical protein